MPTPDVQIALVGALSAIVTVALPLWAASRRTREHVNEARAEVAQVAASVATNHGKRPGEYLEMVADVKVTMDMVSEQMGSLVRHLADHTAADAMNFAHLEAGQNALHAQVAELLHGTEPTVE